MKKIFNISVIFFSSILGVFSLSAQVLPVGTPVLEDYYRREQLLGRVDSTLSFTIRPLSALALQRSNVFDPDSSLHTKSQVFTKDGKGFLQILPVNWAGRFTSTYPYGWNDGPMIPAKGFQTMLSAGIFAKYKFLSIQFQPEIITAENKVYEGFGGEQGPSRLWYTMVGNKIDMPELFGRGSYSKAYLGQSSIRLNFSPVSIGLSTENLWWGPGMRNSLMMSNTAPGVPHITINTIKPIKTWIGSFEGQIIGGRLDASGYLPSVGENISGTMNPYYNPKPDDWRYLSGIILTYQPKWTPGLTFGLIRNSIMYHGEMDEFRDYIPFFDAALKSSGQSGDGVNREDVLPRDQYVSFFFRYAVPAAQFEVYGEYGRNDHPWDFQDLVTQTDHSRAYIAGFRKLFDLHRASGAMLQINGEVTQLAATRTDRIRALEPWYAHYQVRDGYTNRGQVLGAGIGPGSNVQSLNVSWLRGYKQIGFQLERFVHNEDFGLHNSLDLRRGWVDFGAAAHGQWDHKHFLFFGTVQYMHAFNYQYQLENNPDDFWGFEKKDKDNLFIQLGLSYRF